MNNTQVYSSHRELKSLLNKKFLFAIFFIFSIFTVSAQGNPFINGNKPAQQPKQKQQSELMKKNNAAQKNIREKISNYIEVVKHKKDAKIITISLLLAALYGILHALGPGHRKVVMFSYFASNKSKWYEPFAAGFSISGLHALGAVAVVLGVYYAIRTTLQTKVDSISRTMEIISYASIAVMGLVMLILGLISFIKTLRQHNNPAFDNINQPKMTRRKLILLILTTGPVPCPGASLILIMALTSGLLGFGLAMVLAMSVGMGLTVSLISVAANLSHRGIKLIPKRKEIHNKIKNFIMTKTKIIPSIKTLLEKKQSAKSKERVSGIKQCFKAIKKKFPKPDSELVNKLLEPTLETLGSLVILVFGIFQIVNIFF
jgi:ABC-type nickel/cobalt efflux system permease component RcnA